MTFRRSKLPVIFNLHLLLLLLLYAIRNPAFGHPLDPVLARRAVERNLYHYNIAEELTAGFKKIPDQHHDPTLYFLEPGRDCAMDLRFEPTGVFLSGTGFEIVNWYWDGPTWTCTIDSMPPMLLSAREPSEMRLLQRGVIGVDSANPSLMIFISGHYFRTDVISDRLPASRHDSGFRALLTMIYTNYQPQQLRWKRSGNRLKVEFYSSLMERGYKFEILLRQQ